MQELIDLLAEFERPALRDPSDIDVAPLMTEKYLRWCDQSDFLDGRIYERMLVLTIRGRLLLMRLRRDQQAEKEKQEQRSWRWQLLHGAVAHLLLGSLLTIATTVLAELILKKIGLR